SRLREIPAQLGKLLRGTRLDVLHQERITFLRMERDKLDIHAIPRRDLAKLAQAHIYRIPPKHGQHPKTIPDDHRRIVMSRRMPKFSFFSCGSHRGPPPTI